MDNDYSVSKPVAVGLLLAVTVIIASLIGVIVFNLDAGLYDRGTNINQAAFDIEETDDSLLIEPLAVNEGDEIAVVRGSTGETVMTIDAEDVGNIINLAKEHDITLKEGEVINLVNLVTGELVAQHEVSSDIGTGDEEDGSNVISIDSKSEWSSSEKDFAYNAIFRDKGFYLADNDKTWDNSSVYISKEYKISNISNDSVFQVLKNSKFFSTSELYLLRSNTSIDTNSLKGLSNINEIGSKFSGFLNEEVDDSLTITLSDSNNLISNSKLDSFLSSGNNYIRIFIFTSVNRNGLGSNIDKVILGEKQDPSSLRPDCSNYQDSSLINYEKENGFNMISNVYDLQCINEYGPSKDYRLSSDIDASSTKGWALGSNGLGFDPISEFSGILDGNDKKISDLSIINNGGAGIIKENTGTIKDLTLSSVTVQSTTKSFYDRTGSLASLNKGTVNDVTVSGQIRTGRRGGGLIGFNKGGEITNSKSSVKIVGESFIGGLVGQSKKGEIVSSSFDGTVEQNTNTNLDDIYNESVGDASDDYYIGGLVGFSNSLISKSSSTGEVKAGGEGWGVGGLAGGHGGENGIIKNSYSNSLVKGDYNVGGLVGFDGAANDNGGSIVNSSSDSNVDGVESVGGLFGTTHGGSIIDSTSQSIVNGDNQIGGLGGDASDNAKILRSSSSGDVSGSSNIGGLVGSLDDGSRIIESYSSSKTEGKKGSAIGGLVGFMNQGTINNSYSEGDISINPVENKLESEVGGLVGDAHSESKIYNSYSVSNIDDSVSNIIDDASNDGGLVGNTIPEIEINNSYWDVNASGINTSDGGTGLTTEEMSGNSANNNMEGFDFNNIWDIVSGDYPKLKWE